MGEGCRGSIELSFFWGGGDLKHRETFFCDKGLVYSMVTDSSGLNARLILDELLGLDICSS